jgi:hypothetical protein
MAETRARATLFANDAGRTLDDPITMSETINSGLVPFSAECAATPRLAAINVVTRPSVPASFSHKTIPADR